MRDPGRLVALALIFVALSCTAVRAASPASEPVNDAFAAIIEAKAALAAADHAKTPSEAIKSSSQAASEPNPAAGGGSAAVVVPTAGSSSPVNAGQAPGGPSQLPPVAKQQPNQVTGQIQSTVGVQLPRHQDSEAALVLEQPIADGDTKRDSREAIADSSQHLSADHQHPEPHQKQQQQVQDGAAKADAQLKQEQPPSSLPPLPASDQGSQQDSQARGQHFIAVQPENAMDVQQEELLGSVSGDEESDYSDSDSDADSAQHSIREDDLDSPHSIREDAAGSQDEEKASDKQQKQEKDSPAPLPQASPAQGATQPPVAQSSQDRPQPPSATQGSQNHNDTQPSTQQSKPQGQEQPQATQQYSPSNEPPYPYDEPTGGDKPAYPDLIRYDPSQNPSQYDVRYKPVGRERHTPHPHQAPIIDYEGSSGYGRGGEEYEGSEEGPSGGYEEEKEEKEEEDDGAFFKKPSKKAQEQDESEYDSERSEYPDLDSESDSESEFEPEDDGYYHKPSDKQQKQQKQRGEVNDEDAFFKKPSNSNRDPGSSSAPEQQQDQKDQVVSSIKEEYEQMKSMYKELVEKLDRFKQAPGGASNSNNDSSSSTYPPHPQPQPYPPGGDTAYGGGSGGYGKPGDRLPRGYDTPYDTPYDIPTPNSPNNSPYDSPTPYDKPYDAPYGWQPQQLAALHAQVSPLCDDDFKSLHSKRDYSNVCLQEAQGGRELVAGTPKRPTHFRSTLECCTGPNTYASLQGGPPAEGDPYRAQARLAGAGSSSSSSSSNTVGHCNLTISYFEASAVTHIGSGGMCLGAVHADCVVHSLCDGYGYGQDSSSSSSVLRVSATGVVKAKPAKVRTDTPGLKPADPPAPAKDDDSYGYLMGSKGKDSTYKHKGKDSSYSEGDNDKDSGSYESKGKDSYGSSKGSKGDSAYGKDSATYGSSQGKEGYKGHKGSKHSYKAKGKDAPYKHKGKDGTYKHKGKDSSYSDKDKESYKTHNDKDSYKSHNDKDTYSNSNQAEDSYYDYNSSEPGYAGSYAAGTALVAYIPFLGMPASGLYTDDDTPTGGLLKVKVAWYDDHTVIPAPGPKGYYGSSKHGGSSNRGDGWFGSNDRGDSSDYGSSSGGYSGSSSSDYPGSSSYGSSGGEGPAYGAYSGDQAALKRLPEVQPGTFNLLLRKGGGGRGSGDSSYGGY